MLAAYSLGLPAVVLIRSALASFYSRSDTTTPLYASLTAVAVNVMFKIILTGTYGVVGLALATVIGAWVNLLLLVILAKRRAWTAPDATLAKTIAAALAGCVLLALFVIFARAPIAGMLPGGAIPVLAALAIGGGVIYGACLLTVLRLSGERLRRK